MVGANPKFRTSDEAGQMTLGLTSDLMSSGVARRWRGIGLLSAFVPLSLALVQCGQAPNAGTLAANAQVSPGDSFDDRFPRPQFKDRFPTASESLPQRTASSNTQPPAPRTARAEQAPYQVASLTPQAAFEAPAAREDLTTLVSLKSRSEEHTSELQSQ